MQFVCSRLERIVSASQHKKQPQYGSCFLPRLSLIKDGCRNTAYNCCRSVV